MADPYLTPDGLRASVRMLDDTGRYPDAVLAALVAEFEWIAEDYRGVAFTPRETTEVQMMRPGSGLIIPNWPMIRSVESVTADGTALDPSTYRAREDGAIELTAGLAVAGAYPLSRVVVAYTHGYDVPTSTSRPGAVLLRACREYVRISAVADRSAVPRDIIATSSDGMTTRYSTPDKSAGRPTGYLDVDRLLNSLPDHRIPVFA